MAGLQLGDPAPDFELEDTGGKTWNLASVAQAKALIMVFICNHCPYVKHLKPALADLGDEMAGKNVALIAINSNDATAYPADSPEKMAEDVERFHYGFPYLYDESQDVARAYGAVCTPDFYLFDEKRKLVYRGQFDDSRPGNDRPVTGKDLREAIGKVLAGDKIDTRQIPSVGCSIKWKR